MRVTPAGYDSKSRPARSWNRSRIKLVRQVLCWGVLLLASVALVRDVARMDGWRDHGLFYYAPRLFLQGRNAYDWDEMKQSWRADGKPLGVDPGTTMSGFVTPPSMALLTLVPSLAPPQFGFRAIDLWNLAALGVCLIFLMADAAARWPLEARILFAAFVLTMPDVAGVLLLGQSTLVVCACLSAAIYYLRRPVQNRIASVAAGILVGLALAKFTLSIQFAGLLAYRRKWLALTAAVATFAAINVVMSMPGGVLKPLQDFRAAVSRENRPGTSYDAISSNQTYMPNTLVHGKRLLYMAFGERRSLIDALNTVLSIAMIAAMAWLMRYHGRPVRALEEPLEIVLLMIAGLVLFYHRTYDLAALLIAGYAIVDEGFRGKDRRNSIWLAMAAVFLIITHTAALVYAVGRWLPVGSDVPALLCWSNCLLLVALFALCSINLAQLRRGRVGPMELADESNSV